jgi:hypothetical protein
MDQGEGDVGAQQETADGGYHVGSEGKSRKGQRAGHYHCDITGLQETKGKFLLGVIKQRPVTKLPVSKPPGPKRLGQVSVGSQLSCFFSARFLDRVRFSPGLQS